MDNNVSLLSTQATTPSLSTEQVHHLLQLQSSILESVAHGDDYLKSLDSLCRSTESLLPNSVASIMLFNTSNQYLEVKAAPSIPAEAIEFLNGLEPGPEAGSCGTAVFRNEPQFVTDTRADPRWVTMQKFASEYNICSCWSVPIRAQQKKAIGSLALSSFEMRTPSSFHKQLLATGAHLASIILEREKEKTQLWKIGHYDTLTNLPNRTLFNIHFEHAVGQAQRKKNNLALLLLDLDRFKDINDTLGHQAGDEIIKQAAKVISSCLRKEDVLARLGGDEFLLLLDDVEDTRNVHHVAEKIINAFHTPLLINSEEHHFSTSIGISLFPDDGNDLLALQKNADIAMYAAKSKGHGKIVYYQPALTQAVYSRITMAKNLRLAIQEEQLSLHYQPQYDTKSGALAAVEVLLRWQTPDNKSIPPLEFIPIAEDTGLIDEIGDYVTRMACQQCVDWWRKGLSEFRLSINLSVKQLQDGYAERLLQIIDDVQFPAHLLEMEITESLVMEKGNDVIPELNKLKAAGISIAMDDFGTGHSSLALLKHLPISKLKIDRSFVRDIPDDPNDMTIARTIIAMGHTLDLEVVAEGVETEIQKDFLSEEGCDFLQGYLLSKPLSVEEFEALLSETAI